MTGLVQRRVDRCVAPQVETIADQTCFGLAPVAAWDRCRCRDACWRQAEWPQQPFQCVDADVVDEVQVRAMGWWAELLDMGRAAEAASK